MWWCVVHVTGRALVVWVGRDGARAPRQKGVPLNFFGGADVAVEGLPVGVRLANRGVTFELRARP